MRLDEELYMENLKDKYKIDKYLKPGIYSISINDVIVYIGKSKNMLQRICQHQAQILYKNPKEKKYSYLKYAREKGCTIQFDVLYSGIDIQYEEAKWINEKMPMLNTQIPYLEHKGWRNKQLPTLEEFEQQIFLPKM